MSFAELQHKFFDMLMGSQFWSPDDMRRYQRNQLGQLLRHARANVPFYRERLEMLFRPDGEIDWDRWGEVPIVKRADLAERGQELLAAMIPKNHGGTTVSKTSGTSGRPVEVTSTQLANVAIVANRFRAYKWHGADWSRDIVSIFGDDPRSAAWPDGERLGSWGPPWDLASADGTLTRLNRVTSNDRIVEFLARTKPRYLATGPKLGLAIALEAERLGADIRIDAFFPQGAMLGDLEREAMKRVFGARTAELYSSKEGGQMAHGCPIESGLHVNAESVLVEIVDDNGQPCRIGEPGRVIVTPFFNSAQPLIRYEQGDTAEWMPQCSCGRHLPRIAGLIGRSTGLFYHPDGRVRSAFLRAADRLAFGAREWQVAQTGPHLFEVRYVPVDWDAVGDEAMLAARIRDLYFDDAEVRFVRLRELSAGPNGKVAEYANEWLPGGPSL